MLKKQRTLPYVAFFKDPDTMRYILISKKQFSFLYVLYYVDIYNEPDTMPYILMSKKQCTIRYIYIYTIYRVVLIPNYKARTIGAIRSKNKFELFIENWSYSYDE